jgi:ectoine hydroxylase-related dioxygenase (phytanoyl-CoA dioxygenase family)
MIKRRHGNLVLMKEPAPLASQQLERDGFALVRAVLTPEEVAALGAEVTEVFETSGADRPQDIRDEFRHGMLNRSQLSQRAVGSRAILDVVEPLLGEDCHVIANTAWRNQPGHQGGPWHCDAGPHIPRPENVPWPDAIPYPVFAIGVHIFLQDCPLEAGPTAVLPGSHRSGRLPPRDRITDLSLTFENKPAVLLPANAGDAILFVSDAWHRGTAAEPGNGRFFLQVHYARRDIAQRIAMTSEVNQVTPDAATRATTERERTLIGLHAPFFYDA